MSWLSTRRPWKPLAAESLFEENVSTTMEAHTREGHPLRWLHGPLKDPCPMMEYGEKLGRGMRSCE
jgi:hypothetical protein